MVRTLADPDTLGRTISREIWAAFPEQPVTDLATISRTISKSVGDERMRSTLLVMFAGIGFALALIGAYGVVSYSVARRIPEIGIRMALGATPEEVLRMVLRQGIVLAATGVAIGAAGAFALTRVIESQLYGVRAAEPKTFVLAAVVMLGVACLACCIPAKRAMRVDPMVALHYE